MTAPEDGAGRRVAVSRSGGLTGTEVSGEVVLGEDPRSEQVEGLLAATDLGPDGPGGGSAPQPDRFVYTFRVGGREHVLGEQDLTPELAELARLLLPLTGPDPAESAQVHADVRPDGPCCDRLLTVLTIGLIGGMSWESSIEYYKLLNTGVEARLGGLHSAKVVMASVEFAELTALQEAERWDDVATLLAGAARGLQAAGADLLLMCTTAFHKVADAVEAAVDIPFLHLADVVAQAAKDRGMTSVGLLGTSFTMSRVFFTERIASHGLEVLVPDERHHETINRIVYDEVVHGKFLDSSRAEVVAVIEELWDTGAQGVILGCTELELLVKQADSELPVFPCTTLHVEAALERAL